VLVWCPWQILKAFRVDRRRTAVLSFVWLNAVYLLVVGNLFENYENMRFSFRDRALIALACAVAVGDLLVRLRPAARPAARARAKRPSRH